MNLTVCPICENTTIERLAEIKCGSFDDSFLYDTVKVVACSECGHVFNELQAISYKNLNEYYKGEYSLSNKHSSDKTGDRPGSKNKNTLKRYTDLFNLIEPHIHSDHRVLDVGCAMGGFLDFLRAKGIKALSGIDIVDGYLDAASPKSDYAVKVGSAESIPFADSSFDLVVLDQVLEHLLHPRIAFREAGRVLSENGLVCVGVPDALRYREHFFFDFYWFIMREHIQHFDLHHLEMLAAQEGFELVDFQTSQIPMMSETNVLPNLNAVFRKTDVQKVMPLGSAHVKLSESIKQFINASLIETERKKKMIKKLLQTDRPVYFWGVGREFLFLYKTLNLNPDDIAGLIDSNTYKQRALRVEGRKIEDPSILNNAPSNACIVVSAIAHEDEIIKRLQDIGFLGEVVQLG